MLHIDFETRSTVDLIGCGAYRYAQAAEIICLGWAVDDDEPQIWLPGQPVPEPVMDTFAAGKRRSIYAHNAQFERLITKHCLSPGYGVPEPPMEAFYCTAAQARASALPGGLDPLARLLKLSVLKSRRGRMLIRELCIPPFSEDPGLLAEMYDYCKRDVVVERLAAAYSYPLSEEQFDDYLVSEEINDRGLRVDLPLAHGAAAYAEEERAEINAALSQLTDGKIETARQFQRIKAWVLARMPELEDEMVVYKNDERKLSLDKAVRFNILSRGDLIEEVREFLELCDNAGASSVYKFKGMVNRADKDGRVRGAYIFSGAGQTGRYSSTGLQVHNLVRKCAPHPGKTRKAILNRGLGTEVMHSLASMQRPAIVPAVGHSFVCGDWAAFEAVILPWLAGADDHVARWQRIFDGHDVDMYVQEAMNFYHAQEITPFERQIGKVAVLSLGYQGGHRAFTAMARAYGIKVEQETAERIKDAWRANNRWAVAFWRQLERAVAKAMCKPGAWFPVGRLAYMLKEPYLYCRLPSGRLLSYPMPAYKPSGSRSYGNTTVAKASWMPKAGDDDWPTMELYGGLLAENATQGTQADVLRHALRLCTAVGHTHDEILLEVPDDTVTAAKQHLRDVMTTQPAWAPDLPVKVEIWSGKRYRK